MEQMWEGYFICIFIFLVNLNIAYFDHVGPRIFQGLKLGPTVLTLKFVWSNLVERQNKSSDFDQVGPDFVQKRRLTKSDKNMPDRATNLTSIEIRVGTSAAKKFRT